MKPDNYLDNLSSSERQRMMDASSWYNDKLLTDDDLDDINKSFEAFKGRRIHYDNIPDIEKNITVISQCIKPVLLCEEFFNQSNKRRNNNNNNNNNTKQNHRTCVIYHQIEKKSSLYRNLFEWSIMKNIIAPFFHQIHYQIYGLRKEPFLNTDQPTANLQNKLAISHFHFDYITPVQILPDLENILNITLHHCLVDTHLIILIFEWSGTLTPFSIALGFLHNITNEDCLKYLKSDIFSLSRLELVSHVKRTEKKENKRKKVISESKDPFTDEAKEVLMKDILISELRDCFISYITLAYFKKS